MNQIKTLNENSGNTLKTKEVMRIVDGDGNFYFRFPWNLKIAPDGNIYIQDHNQFLRFNSKGKMLNNYYKKGQGPAEMVSMKNFIINEDNLIVLNARPNKILWFQKKGPHIKELRIEPPFFSGNLLMFRDNKYYIATSGIPTVKKKSGFADRHYSINELSIDGKQLKKLKSFPVKTFVVMFEGGGRATKGVSSFIYRVFENRYLVLSHSQEYCVKIYDMISNQITATFSRKYRRTKFKPKYESEVMISGKKYKELMKEYADDIKGIFISGDKIWVLTSTENKKGVLIDVFNMKGKFLDYFYIKLKGKLMAVDGKYIFVRQKDEKYGNSFFVKYKMTNF